MDPMPPLTLTPILREAAERRIEELNQVKNSFERRYNLFMNQNSKQSTVERVSALLEDIKRLDPYLENDDDLLTMTRYVAQAHHDRSISETKMLEFERRLRDKVRKHLHRMEVSLLHAGLMQEVMNTASSTTTAAGTLGEASLHDDFEMVENGLDEVFKKFEKDVLTAKDVDAEAIEAYLSALFAGEQTHSGLEDLREEMHSYGEGLMDGDMEVDQDILMWIIMDLLKSNLVSDSNKRTLEGYLQSPIALRELAATLNMKSFRHWRYRNAENGLPINVRQNAEGQYCVVIDEDITDLLFLHCTAIGWASKLKECLKNFALDARLFRPRELSVQASKKRQCLLNPVRRPNKPKASACSVCHTYYSNSTMTRGDTSASPPSFPDIPEASYEDFLEKKEKRGSCGVPTYFSPPPSPPPCLNSLDGRRCEDYLHEFFMLMLPTHDGSTPKVTRPEEIQARLIKTLAVEAKLRRCFDGDAYALTLVFDSLAATLPHKTIMIILRFLGIPDDFLHFFMRFLEAKINVGSAAWDAPGHILTRSCGVPAGHGLASFFTEAVLFFFDLSVHQVTQSYLYRLNDTCYFIGTERQQSSVMAEATRFATFMGLNVRHMPSGREGLQIGCLRMIVPSGLSYSSVSFKIDNFLVTAYAQKVKKSLGACTTLLDWIRVWNSTVGTYARHLFGPLAEVFGKTHLEAVNSAYLRIFSILFPNSDLTNHVTTSLRARMKSNSKDQCLALEALIYLPQAHGGLGVKNPFFTLNLAHGLCDIPDAKIWNYIKEEETYAMHAAKLYSCLTTENRQKKLDVVLGNNEDRINTSLGIDWDLKSCMFFNEITAHREYTAYPSLPLLPGLTTGPYPTAPCLLGVYRELLYEPVDAIDVSCHISNDVCRLAGVGDMKSWHGLSGEEQWAMGMYGTEAIEQFGTVEIWWPEGVPKEVYKAVRGHVWGDGFDDCASCSSVL